MAYVDILAKEVNGVKYLPVRPDMFDRTVEANRMNTKDPKERVHSFLTLIKKRIDRTKFGSTREQNLVESSRNFAKLKQYAFTRQRARLGCIC